MNTRNKDEMIARIETSPIMGPEETHLCVFLAQHGERNAESRVVAGHGRMVLSIARKYHRDGMDLRDLVQAGSMGLHEAIYKYDFDKDTKFSSFAYFWIRLRVQREIARMRDQIKAPIGVYDRRARIGRAQDKYARENGGLEAPVEWLAVECKSTVEQVVSDLKPLASVVAFDAGATGDEVEGLEPVDYLALEQPSPEDQMIEEEKREGLMAALDCLPEDMMHVVLARYFRGEEVKEVARDMGISVEEVEALETEALAELRMLIEGSELEVMMN